MQFKHPELLYALLLLLIPIIVHLFQFRKFQKEAFTNVAFLKQVTLQTRKSSQLKKWLALLTRLLLLAAIIFAFAQPYFTNTNLKNSKQETVIYLDNSFSMQAKGSKGELLKRAVQDLINNIPENENISLFTNETTYKNTTIKSIKNDLLNLKYSSKALSYEAVFLKSKRLINASASLKKLIFISDFQQQKTPFESKNDSFFKIYAVKLRPVSTNNISVDSAYISNISSNAIDLKVILKNSGASINNQSISLFNNKKLIAKTSVSINKQAETSFTVPVNETINGKITIEDACLQYDNSLFFNINKTPKINVLSINNQNDDFLKRLYKENEFNYTSSLLNQLDYNIINEQNLIVLNELETIPASLLGVLKSFTKQGGFIIVIPSKKIDMTSYNSFLINYNASFISWVETEKLVTTINYSNRLYASDVFEKKVSNFQYPKVDNFYTVSGNLGSQILQYEDNKPFLFDSNQVYIFTAPLNSKNSNFKNSPLIVPTFYNIAKFSLKISKLYYNIGNENTFDVSVNLHQDDILSLVNEKVNLIPRQQYYNNKVIIKTNEEPSESGVYAVKDKTETIQNVSYNYDRNESNLVYQNLSNIKNITLSNSVTDIFDTIKSETKVNELWKWFVIFALVFLLIEMLILKYLK